MANGGFAADGGGNSGGEGGGSAGAPGGATCTPTFADCKNVECGRRDNGCGKLTECGSCESFESCSVAGRCTNKCYPQSKPQVTGPCAGYCEAQPEGCRAYYPAGLECGVMLDVNNSECLGPCVDYVNNTAWQCGHEY